MKTFLGSPGVWGIAAGLCLVAAVALWLTLGADAAFVAASLGVVAWFLNVRATLKRKNPEAFADVETTDDEEEQDTDDEEDEEPQPSEGS